MRILYVVHRYAPHPGGSENYVRDLAQETLSRGHEVWVLANQHMDDYNGVRLTSNQSIIYKPWDMIIVHGTQQWQQQVLRKFRQVSSPTIFMPVEMPSDHENMIKIGARFSKYVAYSTKEDYKFIEKYKIVSKSVHIRHGVNKATSTGLPGFKKKYNISTSKMVLSSGGFWKHKNIQNLIDNFNIANPEDTTLVITGYWNAQDQMDELVYNPETTKVFLLDDRDDVLSAMNEADLYVLNSTREGFGIVLIEAMLNKLPWISRDTPGALEMQDFGKIYTTDKALVNLLKNVATTKDEDGYSEAINNRLIEHAVDDIFNIIAKDKL